MKNKKFKIALIITVAFLLCIFTYIIIGNNAISLSTHSINSDKIDDNNSFTIVHVSDLHNKEFGKDNKRLINKIKKCEPDIIAVTGDVIDSYKTDTQAAITFMKEASVIAPCYFSPGNHEHRLPDDYNTLKSELESYDITILENESLTLKLNENAINIIGLLDPNYSLDDPKTYLSTQLSSLKTESENFTLLLSHRPELFETYVEYDVDLVLSGHAHGGQFRIPFVGGLFAPHQGAFPKYDSGMFSENDTNMIVSRGLGNSIFPVRLNNTPEIISITIY